LVYVATGVGAIFLWCWFRTLRRQVIGAVPPRDESYVYATWHRGLLYAVYHWRWRRGVMMASASRDGEWAAGMIERFGNRAVRGSSSRGGREALHELTRAIDGGASGGLLPDAPRGPARRCKPGILALAQRTGRAIVPVQFAFARCVRAKSWDRTMVPMPLSRVAIVYGEPFTVDAMLEGEAFRRRLTELDAEMNRVADAADAYFSQRQAMPAAHPVPPAAAAPAP
jgi:lysophospholipid acyltransferase (LPLAT)-like uncharacterized protein